MGLDSAELIMRVERDFDLDITDADAERFLTVGDLHGWLLSTLNARGQLSPAGEPWTDAALLETLRDIIVDEVGVRRDQIRLDAHFRKDLGIE